jgi:hypothetical protein
MLRTFLLISALAALALQGPAAASDLAAGSYTIGAPQGIISVKKGQKASVKVSVVTKPGAHVSPDAPVSVALSGGPGLEIPKAKLSRTDSRPSPGGGLDIELPFIGKSAGNDELKAGLVFFVCLKELCERQQKSLAFQVKVE